MGNRPQAHEVFNNIRLSMQQQVLRKYGQATLEELVASLEAKYTHHFRTSGEFSLRGVDYDRLVMFLRRFRDIPKHLDTPHPLDKAIVAWRLKNKK